jgi:8-oxo-dGTP pyrophosphatase MutT (NUDIX family)
MTSDAIAELLPDAPPESVPGPPPEGRAAVAVVLRPRPAAWPEMLMIKRSEREGDPWSGHMAFPGGREEPTDPTLLATAIRETQEELGLGLGPATRLGSLDPVYTPRVTPLRVDAWVFSMPAVPPLQPNHEVQSTHWFGLERLLTHEGRSTFPFTWRGNPIAMPCVRLDGCFIWGMSLRMIDDLLGRLRAHPDTPRP